MKIEIKIRKIASELTVFTETLFNIPQQYSVCRDGAEEGGAGCYW